MIRTKITFSEVFLWPPFIWNIFKYFFIDGWITFTEFFWMIRFLSHQIFNWSNFYLIRFLSDQIFIWSYFYLIRFFSTRFLSDHIRPAPKRLVNNQTGHFLLRQSVHQFIMKSRSPRVVSFKAQYEETDGPENGTWNQYSD